MKPGFITDKAATEWKVLIDVNAMRRIRDLLGIQDIGDLRLIPKVLEAIEYNDLLVVDFLWAICQPQIETRELNRDSFGVRFQGDLLDKARQMIGEGIVNFFQGGKREIAAQALKIIRAGRLDEEAKSLATISSMTLTIAPPSSGSTPEATPSAA